MNFSLETLTTIFNSDETRRSFQQDESLTGFLPCFAKNGRTDSIEFLIQVGADVHCLDASHKSASDYALEGQKFDNLLVLLQNDAPFPNNFDAIFVGLDELKRIKEDRKEFFDSIRFAAIRKISNFNKIYSKLQVCYNLNNETALSTALRHEQFEVYAYLLFKKFSDNKHELLRRNLGLCQKNAITLAIQRYFSRPVDSHVFFLYSKSRFGLDQETPERAAFIQNLYEQLNAIVDISPILKVLEHTNSLSITFDFNNRAVANIDFTQVDRTLGVCYFISGRIYVGAARPANEVLGTLIHELTHYAMQIIFDNQSQPFDASDRPTRQRYTEILMECNKQDKNHSLIKNVFQNYEANVWNQELIVVVPQLIALGELDNLLTNYPKLYEFYIHNVLPKARLLTNDPLDFQNRREIQNLNDRLGVFEAIQKSQPKLHKKDLFSSQNIRTQNVKILVSKVPKLVMENIYQSLTNDVPSSEIKSNYIFAKLSDCAISTNVTGICNLSATALPVIDGSNFEDDLLSMIRYARKFIIVVDSEVSATQAVQNLNDRSVEVINVKYTWSELLPKVQEEVLWRNILFQGEKVKLRDLAVKKSSSIVRLPVDEIMNGKTFEVGSNIPLHSGYNPKYFIERTFMLVENENRRIFKPKYFDRFLLIVKLHRLIVISADAGMGKSTVFSHIALKLKNHYSDHWIIKVNLHEKIDALIKFNEHSKNLNIFEFLVRFFVESKTNLRKKFLSHFLNLVESSYCLMLLMKYAHVTEKIVSPLSKAFKSQQFLKFGSQRDLMNEMFSTVSLTMHQLN